MPAGVIPSAGTISKTSGGTGCINVPPAFARAAVHTLWIRALLFLPSTEIGCHSGKQSCKDFPMHLVCGSSCQHSKSGLHCIFHNMGGRPARGISPMRRLLSWIRYIHANCAIVEVRINPCAASRLS